MEKKEHRNKLFDFFNAVKLGYVVCCLECFSKHGSLCRRKDGTQSDIRKRLLLELQPVSYLHRQKCPLCYITLKLCIIANKQAVLREAGQMVYEIWNKTRLNVTSPLLLMWLKLQGIPCTLWLFPFYTFPITWPFVIFREVENLHLPQPAAFGATRPPAAALFGTDQHSKRK